MSGLDHVPDARDGLTRVERSVLQRLVSSDEQRTKARPPIDAARRGNDFTRGGLYDALVRMAQPWVSRHTPVDGEGHFGSNDGDPPAASRYTEVRLSNIGMALFGADDLRIPPGSTRMTIEGYAPLTGAFPQLLANGTSAGISSIPPHHLGELAQAIGLRIDQSKSTLDQVLAVMPGPDYPTGAEIVDADQIRDAYETGKGMIEVCAIDGPSEEQTPFSRPILYYLEIMTSFPASPTPDHPPAALLVLDAHEPARIGLGVLLQREAWVSRCFVVGTEERARLLVRRHRPAAAVVDVSSLGPFAGAVVSSLREDSPGLQVVLTAHCPGASVPNPRALGAASFVPAGTSAAQTIATVHAAIHEEPAPLAFGVDAPASSLSQRERDVLALLATGATNREIAAQLFLGPDTVKKHASSLYRKLGVRNRTEATQQAAGLLALA